MEEEFHINFGYFGIKKLGYSEIDPYKNLYYNIALK
jgi:hypothetical protein